MPEAVTILPRDFIFHEMCLLINNSAEYLKELQAIYAESVTNPQATVDNRLKSLQIRVRQSFYTVYRREELPTEFPIFTPEEIFSGTYTTNA